MPENQPGKGLGHFLGAMSIDAFRPAEEFLADMDQWIRRFRDAHPVAGQERVIIPGDPERVFEAERRTHGIPLLPVVWDDLRAVGEKFGINL
jgi:LDH2 family malate/lactate/ureidoglycolate dehydrogenase